MANVKIEEEQFILGRNTVRIGAAMNGESEREGFYIERTLYGYSKLPELKIAYEDGQLKIRALDDMGDESEFVLHPYDALQLANWMQKKVKKAARV